MNISYAESQFLDKLVYVTTSMQDDFDSTGKRIDVQKETNTFRFGHIVRAYDTSKKYLGVFCAYTHESGNVYHFIDSVVPGITGGNIISYEYNDDLTVCTIIFTVNNTTSTVFDFTTPVFGLYCNPVMIYEL